MTLQCKEGSNTPSQQAPSQNKACTRLVELAAQAEKAGDLNLAYSFLKEADHTVSDANPRLKSDLQRRCLRLAPFWRAGRKGRRVCLRRMNTSHFDFLFRCRSDTAFHHQYNLFQDVSETAIRNDLKVAQAPPLDSNKIEWVVERNGKAIGLAALVGLNLPNRRAEILVGFPENPPFGSATEATLLVLEFAFSIIRLNRVYSYVYSDNTDGARNTLHLGFKHEGALREHVYDPHKNRYLDLNTYGLLAKDYFRDPRIIRLTERLLGRGTLLYS